jgi:hypothetical protein
VANFEKENETNPVETAYLELFVKDDVLYCVYKEIEMLDYRIAQICVQDRLNFIGNHSYPSLFDITKVKHSTKEARDYMANEGNVGVTASAMLVSSPMLKMAANFYITVNKPRNPSRLFTDRKEAVKWLQKFIL